MGLFGRKYDGSAIRNAEPTKPETLAFMNGPDLLGNPTSGQVYEDPRGPMNYNPGPTFKQRLGGFLEGTVNDLMHMRGIQNTALDQRRALEMYKRQQQDELAQYERKQQIEAQYDKPAQPHYWESNDGSLMSIGPDGQPVQVYQDKTPKPYMVTNADGTITPYIYNSETSQFQRVGVGGPTGSAGGMPPVKGKLKPYGGGTGSGSGNFPR